jgi:hypothetical protein
LLLSAAQLRILGVKHSIRLLPRARLLLAAIGLLAAGLLATAWRLTPDARGYGTHEQLGMVPCWFMTRTGWPCPTCGMTTAWSYALRGDFRAALATNAGGAATCLLAIAAGLWATGAAISGRMLAGAVAPRAILWIGAACLAITVLDWARRLATW